MSQDHATSGQDHARSDLGLSMAGAGQMWMKFWMVNVAWRSLNHLKRGSHGLRVVERHFNTTSSGCFGFGLGSRGVSVAGFATTQGGVESGMIGE